MTGTAVRLLYHAYGRVIQSDRELPELPSVAGTPASGFTLRTVRALELPRHLRWSLVWAASNGEPDVAFARDGAIRYLRVADRVVVRMAHDGAIDIAAGHADAAWLRHVLLDQVLPLVLASEGETVLHASAVVIDGAAVLLMGDAGTGKSTLASALAQQGFAVLADDGILLEEAAGRPAAVPSYPGLRLWPDAAASADPDAFVFTAMSGDSTKRRLIPSVPGARSAALPVAAVLSLSGDDAPLRFERLSRRNAALQFVRHAFVAEPDVPVALRRHLDRACRWSALARVWSLRRPRDLGRLPELAAAVAAHVRAAASGTLLGR